MLQSRHNWAQRCRAELGPEAASLVVSLVVSLAVSLVLR